MAKRYHRSGPNRAIVTEDLEKLMNPDIRMRFLRMQHGEYARELLGVLAFLVGAMTTSSALKPYATYWHWSARWSAVLAGGWIAGTVVYCLARQMWFLWALGTMGVAIVIWMFL
jgi:hypothetical protein